MESVKGAVAEAWNIGEAAQVSVNIVIGDLEETKRRVDNLELEQIEVNEKVMELTWELANTQRDVILYVLVTYIIFHTDHEAIRDSHNALLESIGGKIEKTREDVKNMEEQITINFTGVSHWTS